MDLTMFGNDSSGTLVPISGTDPRRGPWEHRAFLPDPLTGRSPRLSAATYRAVADARAALAALDSTARQLPNPRLLRHPSLRREAQSTSALEGTYEPLDAVLVADAEHPGSVAMVEVLNFVRTAHAAYDWIESGRPLTLPFLTDLQRILVEGTSAETVSAGEIRNHQVVIGQRKEADPGELAVIAARFVPPPPGADLQARVRDLVGWMSESHGTAIDPVVCAALGHYQFEALHPFADGNGRIGRLLIVVQLHQLQVLSEPTLSVSPWFESRREQYYDRLLMVSCEADWDGWVVFFARGLEQSAITTRQQMLDLVQAQADLKELVRASRLRADTAHALVDYAVSRVTFTVRQVAGDLSVSYGRANKLVADLVELGALQEAGTGPYRRQFFAPRVVDVLMSAHPRP